MHFTKVKKNVEEFIDAILDHEIPILSGSLAYTTALALAPFLVIMLSLTEFLGPETQTKLVAQMTDLLGSQAGTAVSALVDSAKQGSRFAGWQGILSFIVILVSASAIFSQLRYALDKIDEHKATARDVGVWAFLRERILSVGLVLGFVFLLVISLFVTTGIAAVFNGLEGLLWQAVTFVFTLILFAGLFAAMFRFIPSDQFPWKRCAISGMCAAVFFIVGKTLIGIYLGKSAVGSAFGAAGSLAVLLVWLYYSSLTLLVSYEFTNQIILDDDDNKEKSQKSDDKKLSIKKAKKI